LIKSQILNGLFNKIVIAQKTFVIDFCAAKATAKPQIHAHATNAETSYPRFQIIEIAQITQINITIILFIKGSKVLLTALSLDFKINSFSKTTFTKLVRSMRNTIITNTDVI
jgi:hypothetical protein